MKWLLSTDRDWMRMTSHTFNPSWSERPWSRPKLDREKKGTVVVFSGTFYFKLQG
eukprot:m.136876 g.136876  ORF g.136876 m.136876 type:complete len:55 (+) comp22653_c0_seq2:461-625(+)